MSGPPVARPAQAAPRRPAATTRPPIETAELRLGGVVIEAGRPRALISVARGPMTAIGQGEAVMAGLVIERIAFDRVDLRSGAQRRTLRFAPPQTARQYSRPSAPPSAPALRDRVGGDLARDAMARVAYAEAGDQGDAGLAGVVYTIINRLKDGRWGASVEAVVNAPSQFEPVSRVGGDWRNLPAVTAAQRARIDTILNLALDGHLPDLTGGARYFQNPAIVAARVRAGHAPPSLVDFGDARRSVVIGQHAFYAQTAAGPARAGH